VRPLSEIIVHCTATTANWWHDRKTSAKVAEIRLWHVRDRGWKDIGYHFLIDRDGTVTKGRPLEQVGAHVAGHNTGTIGISLFGGHGSNEKDRFDDHFTLAQDKALRALIADLRAKHPTITKVTGHNQYAAKACPGFSVPQWLADAAPAPKPAPAAPEPVAVPVAPAKPEGVLARFLRWLAQWIITGKGT
jgi:N-acetylmuramoyl-L-alanine amidase